MFDYIRTLKRTVNAEQRVDYTYSEAQGVDILSVRSFGVEILPAMSRSKIDDLEVYCRHAEEDMEQQLTEHAS